MLTGRVVGEDGQPLSNVRIIASRAATGAVNLSAGAQTDADGKFTLTNLTANAYVISAFALGYVLEPDSSEQTAARVYHHPGDFVTLRMSRGGVITGMVTDADGAPVVGLFVEAVRVRYPDGRAVREGAGGRVWQPRQTDDRGVYRIYGLRPGAYIVRAGGRSSFGPFTPYDLKVPTYHPAAPREGAITVSVLAGQETSGIDIRYRGAAGHAISGTLSGALPAGSPLSNLVVALRHVSASAPEQYIALQPDTAGFVFDGVADGDYDLLARHVAPRADYAAASPARRVSVRGRDVTGVTLALAPLGSVSGQLLFDSPKPPDDKSACQPTRAPRAGEGVVVVARRDDSGDAADQSVAFFPAAYESAPGDKGEFQLLGLKAGRYQLLVRLPDADLYVRAITLAQPPAKDAPAAKAAVPVKAAAPAAVSVKAAVPVKAVSPARAAGDPARAGFNLQTGERLSGLNVHVAAGASGLRGRIVAAADDHDAASPAARFPHLRVHLVPAEREQADNALRYAESRVGDDGTFLFANLAPGRYWLLARPAPATDSPDNPARPLAWDAEGRARLRREAETANTPVALAPCRRIDDFVLPHPTK